MPKTGIYYYPNQTAPWSEPEEYLSGMMDNAESQATFEGWSNNGNVLDYPVYFNIENGLKNYRSVYRPSVVLFGDSISESNNRNPLPFGIGEGSVQYPALVANLLYTKYGGGRRSSEFARTAGAGWTLEEIGYNLRTMVSDATLQDLPYYASSAEFVPLNARAKVIYMTHPNGGDFQIVKNSDVVHTISCNGAEGEIKTFDYVHEANAFYYIRPVSATNPAYVCGWVGFDEFGARNGFYNLSKGGRQLTQFTEAEIDENLGVWEHDLAILALGSNDYGNNTDLTDYYSRVQYFVNSSKANGKDVMFLIQCGNSDTETGQSKEALFAEMLDTLYTIAEANNCAVVNINTLLGGYNNANTNGLMTDAVHPNYEGTWEIADCLCKPLYDTGLVNFLVPVESKSVYWGYKRPIGLILDSDQCYQSGLKQRVSMSGLGTVAYDIQSCVNANTANRVGSPTKGQMMFDNTLGKPIWYNGTSWVDSAGVSV